MKRALLLGLTLATAGGILLAQRGGGGRRDMPRVTQLSVQLGAPEDHSVAANLLSPQDADVILNWGTAKTAYTSQSDTIHLRANVPVETRMTGLLPNTRYYYCVAAARKSSTCSNAEQTFITQRSSGATFTFGVQGDSHPEREGKMFDPALYERTLALVRAEQPDFYFMLGDDFSIENLIERGDLTQSSVDRVYEQQRAYLSTISPSVPLFLANGNHEEAGIFLLNGKPNSPPLLAGHARTSYFALPSPDAFYTGDTKPIEGVGLLKDYYAWTWGDALFVVIDPYWHSPVTVDAPPGGGHGGDGRGDENPGGGRKGGGGGNGGQRGQGNAARNAAPQRDLWQVTLGDDQFHWLEQTLRASHAKYKFVFAHHVSGTGRGGVEVAGLYEWGGHDRRGDDQFHQHRPTWDKPIHQLFVETGVTIFFQGHDHLFAHQVKDGVVYQETPNPADNTYTAFNRDAYQSGDVLPNTGHLRVTVAPDAVHVAYIRSFLSADETRSQKNGEVAFEYAVAPRTQKGGTR